MNQFPVIALFIKLFLYKKENIDLKELRIALIKYFYFAINCLEKKRIIEKPSTYILRKIQDCFLACDLQFRCRNHDVTC